MKIKKIDLCLYQRGNIRISETASSAVYRMVELANLPIFGAKFWIFKFNKI